MESEKIVHGAEKQTIVKPTINTDPEIVTIDELEDRLQDYWSEILPTIINAEYVYIRMKNNHLEVGPANVEFVE